MLSNSLPLPMVQKPAEVIQQIVRRNAIQRCQLVHDLPRIIVCLPHLIGQIAVTADANALRYLLLHQPQMVAAPSQTLRHGAYLFIAAVLLVKLLRLQQLAWRNQPKSMDI